MAQAFDFVDVVQGTEAWLEWRRGMITASDMSVLYGYGKRSDVFKEKKSPNFKKFQTKAMRDGIEKEPIAREKLEAMLGYSLKSPCIASRETPWAGASLDAFNLEHQMGREIKCFTVKAKHDLVKAGIVPDPYMPQIQWQMYCSGFSSWYLDSYYPEDEESPLASVLVKRNDAMIEDLLEKGKWFRECLDSDTDPEEVEWIEDAIRSDKIDELERLLIQKDECEKKIAFVKNSIVSTIEAPRARGGNLLFIYSANPSRVDYEKLISDIAPEADLPSLKDKYKSPPSFGWKVRRA